MLWLQNILHADQFAGKPMLIWTWKTAIKHSLSSSGTLKYHALMWWMWQARAIMNMVSFFAHLYIIWERVLPWPYALIPGMIKWCSWKGVRLDCPSIFTLFPTNRGMCCSFNMQKADEMFKKSKYREHMERLTKRDKEFSFDNSTLPEW